MIKFDLKKNIVILTGAGVSAESGVRTFRGCDGLWENHRVEDVATPEAYRKNPELVHEFYNARRAQLKEVEPNAAHKSLAEFEKIWKGNFLLITQNVDDLHERAGSKNMIHMHGELRKIRSIETDEVMDWQDDVEEEMYTKIRPHIVWFGEMPMQMERIGEALMNCDYFLSIGTSGNVYPAAGFVYEAKNYAKAKTVEINLEPTQNSKYFDEQITGKAGQILPQILAAQTLKELA